MSEAEAERQRLKEEAEAASGMGTREQAEPAEWARGLCIGDRVSVEPDADVDPFEAVIRGFSDDYAFEGQPVIHPGEVPAEGADWVEWTVLSEDDEVEVVER